MYLRRHCYDKRRRCPGWAGPGWRVTFYDEKPADWDDWDWSTSWEESSVRRTRWYQRRRRCSGGSIWTLDLSDPWRMFRSHRCNTCDVRTIPLFTKYFDPTYLLFCVKHGFSNVWDDIRFHKSRWVDNNAPWWSLPDALWRKFGWRAVRHRAWRIKFTTKYWWKDLKIWASREARETERQKVMNYHGVS